MVEKFPGSDEPESFDAAEKSRKIAALNDVLRTTFQGGQVMMTQGIQNLRQETVFKIFNAVREFNDFSQGNDPYGEHDFGCITVDGYKCFWKIDYYDNNLKYHSPDPGDPEVTQRVLTVMLADEY